MSSSVAGKTAVLQNIHGTMEFLRKYPPFNQMDSAQLAYLVEHCQLRFYAAGESIIKPGDGPVQHFYIVKQGLVVGERPAWWSVLGLLGVIGGLWLVVQAERKTTETV